MSSECTVRIPTSQNIHFIHSKLKSHVIIFNPPYTILDILRPYVSSTGREIRIVIDHASRDVRIVEGSIRSHVLQTTVWAFQRHRLAPSVVRPPITALRPPHSPITVRGRRPPQSTGQECPICYEMIYQNDMCTLPCAHMFHGSCVTQWLRQNPSCPVCRTHV